MEKYASKIFLEIIFDPKLKTGIKSRIGSGYNRVKGFVKQPGVVKGAVAGILAKMAYDQINKGVAKVKNDFGVDSNEEEYDDE